MTEAGKQTEELEIAFQVVEDVHNPLLAVCAIAKRGHSVVFAEEDSHMILKNGGGKLPMRNVHGTYEIDIFVKNSGFTWLSGR